MTVFEITFIVSASGYVLFLLWCFYWWLKQDELSTAPSPFPSVEIIIPARNEALNIVGVLDDLRKQQYHGSSFCITVIDDHSTDHTLQHCLDYAKRYPEFPLTCHRLSDQGSKKNAIAEAVGKSSAEWIVTVDADVQIASVKWLEVLMSNANESADLICGPVVLRCEEKNNFFSRVASLESVGLTAIAAAGIKSGHPIFCNGANLAFRRKVFLDVNGYEGTGHQMTGDDTAIMRKVNPDKIRYAQNQEAVIRALPPYDFSGFILQRQRWASKIPASLSRATLLVSLFAWLTHAGVFLALFEWISPQLAVTFFLLKGVIEFLLLKVAGRFFEIKVNPVLILALQPIYAAAITMIGILSVFLPYQWKGRKSN